ncbi:MAG: hypothetical protein INR62_01505, partial [Rhodospirillales bacterium]|nr:hypothetical protein [Acetobacter sp.]
MTTKDTAKLVQSPAVSPALHPSFPQWLYTRFPNRLVDRMRFATAALSLLVLGSTLAGCAPRTPLACPQPAAISRTAQVYYATDRRRQPDETNSNELRFAGARTNPLGLHLGWERVSLGPAYRLGLVDDAVAIT